MTLSQRLQQLIRFWFYTLFLITPWIWVRQNSELFELPKMVFVYALTILILTTWTVKLIVDKQKNWPRTPLDIPIVAYVLVQIISTILSMHPRTSLYGYYSRAHGGLLSTLSYVGLYYAFTSNFDKHSTLKALGFILSSVIISGLYAFPEHFGYAFSCLAVANNIEATCWIQDVQTRVFGTFGQPNWLAAYLVTLLPLVWYSLIKTTNTNSTLAKTTLLLAVHSLLFATLLFTKSRSGLLALSVGFGIFWSLLLFRFRTSILKPFVGTITATLIILLVFGSEYSPSISEIINRQTNTPAPQTISGTVLDQGDLSIPVINQGGTESGKIREIVWRGAIDIFTHYPLFGAGVETFAYSYYQFRPVEHNIVSEWDFIYNKAHNEILNIAANTGTAGLLSYFLLIGSFWWLTSKASLSSSSPVDELPGLSAALLAGHMALFVSNFFGFSTVSVGIMFFIFPALFIAYQNQPFTPAKTTRLVNTQYIGIAITTLVGLILLFRLSSYYLADIVYAQAQSQESDQNYPKALDLYQSAIQLSPHESLYHNDYANALSKASLVAAIEGDNVAMSDWASRSFHESAVTLTLNPVHLNYYKTQAGVFIRLSTLDESLLEVADTMLSEAITLAPTDAKLVYNLGLVRLDQEATPAAQEQFEKAVSLKSNYEEARMELAAIYTQIGKYQKAIDQYQYILNYIAPGNTKARERMEELVGLVDSSK